MPPGNLQGQYQLASTISTSISDVALETVCGGKVQPREREGR